MKRTLAVALVLVAATALGQMTWNCATDSAAWLPRCRHTSVVFDGRMWLLGGGCMLSGVGVVSDVWYSSDGVNWTQATDSAGWPPRGNHSSVVFDDKMWVIGGDRPRSIPYSDAWCSSDGVNWTQTTGSAGWGPRSCHTSVVFDDKMWLMGGRALAGGGNDVWCSSDGVTWTLVTDSAGWPGRMCQTSIVFDDRMWVTGGWDGMGQLNDVWHSSDGVNWTLATDSAGWSPRQYHSSVVFDGKMWVMGGCWQNTSDAWFSGDGVSWIQATDSAGWSPRHSHSSVVFDGGIWVMGGYDYAREFNDVWNSLGVGIEEVPDVEDSATGVATIARGVLMLGGTGEAEFVDITGRRVADLHPGENDIRRVAPGVYFVRSAGSGARPAVRKVVVQR